MAASSPTTPSASRRPSGCGSGSAPGSPGSPNRGDAGRTRGENTRRRRLWKASSALSTASWIPRDSRPRSPRPAPSAIPARLINPTWTAAAPGDMPRLTSPSPRPSTRSQLAPRLPAWITPSSTPTEPTAGATSRTSKRSPAVSSPRSLSVSTSVARTRAGPGWLGCASQTSTISGEGGTSSGREALVRSMNTSSASRSSAAGVASVTSSPRPSAKPTSPKQIS